MNSERKEEEKNNYRYLKQKYKTKLKGFKSYLPGIGNSENTIHRKLNYTAYFLHWVETEHLQEEDVRYNDMLDFIDHCMLKGKSPGLINRKIASIRAYYEYLKMADPKIINPAVNLHLKGIVKKLPSGIIPYPELEKLYHEYLTFDNRSYRNKVILGLLIYQGLTTGELGRLEPTHLKLKKGKLLVPGSRKSGSRTLELKAFQVLQLHEYMALTRPAIFNEINKPKPARKPGKINMERLNEKLFISINGSENIKNSLFHMFRKIKKTNPLVRSPKQIRISVITYWLKHYNLRKVQYMAGHKYVSSTERYRLDGIDSLQKMVEKFHPLK